MLKFYQLIVLYPNKDLDADIDPNGMSHGQKAIKGKVFLFNIVEDMFIFRVNVMLLLFVSLVVHKSVSLKAKVSYVGSSNAWELNVASSEGWLYCLR